MSEATARSLATETREEFALVAHVRTWVHDSTACPLCAAQFRAFDAERRLNSVISG